MERLRGVLAEEPATCSCTDIRDHGAQGSAGAILLSKQFPTLGLSALGVALSHTEGLGAEGSILSEETYLWSAL